MKKIEKPTKEELYNFYIVQTYSKKELSEYYKISEGTLSRWLRSYNIHKTQDEIDKTNLRLYGTTTPQSLPFVQQKLKDSFNKKYGTDNPMKVPEIKDKVSQTCLEKYGTKYASQNKDVQQKIKLTCLEKYGVTCSLQQPDIKKKYQEKFLIEHDGKNFNQEHIEHYDIWNSQQLFRDFLQKKEKKPTVRELMSFFNVSDVSIGNKAEQFHLKDLINFSPSRSKYEDELVYLLNQWGIKRVEINNTSILDGKEIDIYLPDYKIGIEFNGDYWHSDIFLTDHNGRTTSHQEKSLKALEKGVFLFHIFEREWNNSECQTKIIDRLKTILLLNTIKVPARKCDIVSLSKKEKKEFLDRNHIQGNDHCSVQIGLKYQGELVSCMTFIPSKNKKYTWELSRFCNKKGYIVQGSASKIFKYFLSSINLGDTIVSYNDITKTSGKIYEILGFQCISINQPNYVWINFNTKDIRSRYQEQDSGEVERMHNQNYHRVCDCGTKTWVYTK